MSWNGTKIRNLRRKMSWSPDDLARRIGCSHKLVLEWELERSVPDWEAVNKLTEIEELSMDCSHEIAERARLEILMKDQGLDQVSPSDLEKIEK